MFPLDLSHIKAKHTHTLIVVLILSLALSCLRLVATEQWEEKMSGKVKGARMEGKEKTWWIIPLIPSSHYRGEAQCLIHKEYSRNQLLSHSFSSVLLFFSTSPEMLLSPITVTLCFLLTGFIYLSDIWYCIQLLCVFSKRFGDNAFMIVYRGAMRRGTMQHMCHILPAFTFVLHYLFLTFTFI